MNDNDFFKLTDALDWSKQGDDDKVLKPLIDHLAKCSDEEIFDFEDKMAELLYKLDTPKTAERSYGTRDHFSGDDFLYLRCVALINGNVFYEKILDGSDVLDADMEFEAILYAPAKAWAKKHNSDPDEYPHTPKPDYETGSNAKAWGDKL